MVEKFKKILDEIVSEKGDVNLFAIMMMDDFTDKWSVILSAPWLDNEDTRRINFKLIMQIMKKNLTTEENNSIARIGIFPKKEHLIEELLKYKSGSIINNQKINGNFVHLAKIIESNQDI
jgi:hypothetical protein